MFTAKPTALALTLVFYIALALVLATGSDAKGYAPIPVHRRDHVRLNRLIRKRSPQPQDGFAGGILGGSDTGDGNTNPGAANGAGADPPSASSTSSAATSTPAQSAPTSSNTPTSSKNTPASSSTPPAAPSSTSSTNDPLVLSSVVSSLTNTGSSSSARSSSSASSLPSLSPSSSLSSSSPSVSLTSIAAVSTPPAVPTPTSAHVTVTTQASEASASASAAPTSSSSKITRTTLTVLIVIAACVGGTAIIWTIIRKWKLRTSSQFDERMRPIDWQPTTSDDSIPGHNRAGSSASSFHSGSGHDGLGGGYGSTIDHGRSPSPLPPIPDHDFTAGPSTLAPVGGYADLARGPNPRPQMQEALTRGPSLTRPQYDQYGVPLHHQGGYGSDEPYDYNGARY